jgi:NifU-like protein involved in Fe-S cluster formation
MPRFSEVLLDHARYPRNLGRDDEADAAGRADLDGRPPSVEFFLRLEGDSIARATFHAAGCGVTIAAASAMTELVIGQPYEDCARLHADDVASALDGVPGDKRFCVDVAIAALKDALATVKRSSTGAPTD